MWHYAERPRKGPLILFGVEFHYPSASGMASPTGKFPALHFGFETHFPSV
jgi:hypothetical protein